MAVNPSPFGPKPQFELVSGIPAVGNQLFFYVAGSVNTKQATFTDSTGGSQNTNPIVLNALGVTPNELWFGGGLSYKVVYAPATDTDPPTSPIWTIDNLKGINDPLISSFDQWVLTGFTPTFINTTQFTLPGDQTVAFHPGRRVKCLVNAGTSYGVITASVFGALTTVTVDTTNSLPLDIGLVLVSYGLISHDDSSLPGFIHETLPAQASSYESRATETINAKDSPWNIMGDGITDWATQLYAMRDYMRLSDRIWEVTFEPGTYLYSGNLWSKGIKNLVLNCHGAEFQCTSGSANTFDKQPFVGNPGVFNTFGYTTYNSTSVFYGHLINSVDSGATQVTMSTAGDSANYAPGDPVLLYGHATQDVSFPPNPRYFEWNYVVTSAAGVISFLHPLKNSYDQLWHDFSTSASAQGKGAARIINLNRTDFTLCDSLVVNGGYFHLTINFPSTIGSGMQIEGYRSVVLNEVKTENFTPSITRHYRANTCIGCGTKNEMDKICESIVYDGGTLNGISTGTGVSNVLLTGGVVINGTADCGSDKLIIDGATLACVTQGSAVFAPSSGLFTQSLIDIRSAEFKINSAAVKSLSLGGSETTFLVDSVVSDTKILVLCANAAAFEAIYRRIRVGFTYQLQTGANRVRVSKISDNDATHVAIEGEWSTTPNPAEVYRGSSIDLIRMGDGISQSGSFTPVARARFSAEQYFGTSDRTQRKTFTTKDILRAVSEAVISVNGGLIDVFIRGYLTKIQTTITKAYTGVDATSVVRVAALTPGAVTYSDVNSKTTGVRVVTDIAATTTGAVAGDTLTPTAGAYVDSLRLSVMKPSTFPKYASPKELATWIIELEWQKDPGQ